MEKLQSEPFLSTHLHAMGARLGLPIGGSFELTARCNFNCPMCYVHLSEEQVRSAGRELIAAQWIALARAARDKGMIFALLTGGEPFVRPDFFEIYSAMKAMGLLVSINTNGSMLCGEVRERLLADPPFRLNVSLYGGCRETYRNMCQNDAFETVLDNIRAIKAAGVDVRLNVSITPYNKQDLAKIYALSRELNVHVKATSYMYPSIRVNGGQYGQGDRLSPEQAAEYGVAWDLLRFTPEEFDQRARAMQALQRVDPDSCAAEPEQGVGCRAGSSSFWMTWDGRMLPCGMMPGPAAYPLEVGFDAAWEAIREQTRTIRTPPQCAACPKRQVCCMCAAVCITETGAFDQVPRYVCQFTDHTIRATQQAWQDRSEKK